MSLFGGGGGMDDAVSTQNAKLTREQWEDYKRRFQPIEDYLLGKSENEEERRASVGEAMSMAGQQFDLAQDSTMRHMQRYGIGMDADRMATLERLGGMNKTLSKVGAANNMRQGLEDQQLDMRSNLISMGRGIGADAGSMMGQATSLEANRNATNRQLSAQSDANTMAGIGTIAAIAAAAI